MKCESSFVFRGLLTKYQGSWLEINCFLPHGTRLSLLLEVSFHPFWLSIIARVCIYEYAQNSL
jgi:hypothetical protein